MLNYQDAIAVIRKEELRSYREGRHIEDDLDQPAKRLEFTRDARHIERRAYGRPEYA